MRDRLFKYPFRFWFTCMGTLCQVMMSAFYDDPKGKDTVFDTLVQSAHYTHDEWSTTLNVLTKRCHHISSQLNILLLNVLHILRELIALSSCTLLLAFYMPFCSPKCLSMPPLYALLNGPTYCAFLYWPNLLCIKCNFPHPLLSCLMCPHVLSYVLTG